VAYRAIIFDGSGAAAAAYFRQQVEKIARLHENRSAPLGLLLGKET
jgi:hypothetical protein